jgi:hypothetical protein
MAMHVIEIELRPSTQQITETDGSKRAMIMEPSGPPRWWTGRYGGDGRPVLTDDRGAAAGFATREKAVATARQLGRWFGAETVRVVDRGNPAGGLSKRVSGASPNEL